jgi:hypothetical protein
VIKHDPAKSEFILLDGHLARLGIEGPILSQPSLTSDGSVIAVLQYRRVKW